ncbi:MAG: ribosomal L7Ae/L30e/S12e/Gadd45 family protein [Candidatus Anstonellaceae archaeon]
MASSYILFETPKEIVAKALEAATIAADSGKVKKGANETTRAVNGKTALLVLISSDVEPAEVVMHLPSLCKENNIPFLYIPTQKELGVALGLPKTCSAAAIENAGNASELVDAIISSISPLCGVNKKEVKEEKKQKEETKEKEQHKEKAHKHEKKHEEKKKTKK